MSRPFIGDLRATDGPVRSPGADHDSQLADYRSSHLAKGPDYDEYVARDPFSRYMTNVETQLLGRLVGELFPDGPSSVLDFACGTGRITSVLAPLAARSYGVDVSATMMAEARRKCPSTTFFVHDLTKTDLDLEPVSVVTAFRFFGNAEDSLRLSALAAIHRRLLPSGYLVFNNHRNPWAIGELLGRMTGGRPRTMDLTYAKLARLLQATGFGIVRSYGIGLWIVHHRFNQSRILESRFARAVEPLSRLAAAARFSPDMIVVAKRME